MRKSYLIFAVLFMSQVVFAETTWNCQGWSNDVYPFLTKKNDGSFFIDTQGRRGSFEVGCLEVNAQSVDALKIVRFFGNLNCVSTGELVKCESTKLDAYDANGKIVQKVAYYLSDFEVYAKETTEKRVDKNGTVEVKKEKKLVTDGTWISPLTIVKEVP